MAIQLLSLFLRLLSFPCSLCLSLCLCLYIYIPSLSLLLSPHCLKSNTPSHINFDQSNVLICLAGETVTYWCRFSYTQMKKARRPVSQNISVLTQTFTPHFIFSHSLSQKSQIYPKNFYLLLRWLIVPSSPSRCGREGFIMITIPGIRVYICFLTNLVRWCKMLCTSILASVAFDMCIAGGESFVKVIYLILFNSSIKFRVLKGPYKNYRSRELGEGLLKKGRPSPVLINFSLDPPLQ